jgi:hypothetical protein
VPPLPPTPPQPEKPRSGLFSVPPVQIKNNNEPEDMFSGMGKMNANQYPQSPDASSSISESPARGFGRKVIRLVVAIAVVGSLAVAGYFGYQYFLADRAAGVVPVNNVNNETNVPVVPNINNNESQNIPPINSANGGSENPVVPEPATPPAPTDGVPPATEPIVVQPGTPAPPPPAPAPLDPWNDPTSKTDSDADGITDYDEANIYHSDRLNPDSDGDGFLDGDEVKNGYNPIGPGKMPPR